MTGPIVGGWLTDFISYNQVALVSSIGSAIVTVILVVALPPIQPNTNKEVTSATDEKEHKNAKPANSSFLKDLLHFFNIPVIRALVLIKLFEGIGIAAFRTCFSLMAVNEFGLDPKQNGYIISFVGGFTIFVNSFFVAWCTKRYSEVVIVKTSILVLTGSFLFIAVFTSLPTLILAMFPITVAGTTIATICTSLVTKNTASSDAGTVLGIDMGVGTLSRVIAPLIGGYLLTAGTHSIGIFGVLCGGLPWFVSKALEQAKEGKLDGDEMVNGKQAQ